MPTAEQVLDIFRDELGTVESPAGSNRTSYGRWYGLDGNPWCAMFLSWCFHQAGLPLPATTSKGFAYTPSGANWFKQQGLWGETPAVGAVVFYKFPGSNRINHIGIVESFRPDGSITCIEGNTNSAGSRDGGAVLRKTRRSYVAGYGYPAYGETEPEPKVRSMYDPPLVLEPLAASCPAPNGGAWLVAVSGAVYAFGGAPYLGAPNGQDYWGSRKASRIRPTDTGGYVITATTGEDYAYNPG